MASMHGCSYPGFDQYSFLSESYEVTFRLAT